MGQISTMARGGSPGLDLHGLSRHSPLRSRSFTGVFSNTSGKCIVSDAVPASVTTWQTIAIDEGRRLPLPCTPCITMAYLPNGSLTAYAALGPCTYTFRITGFDAYDRPIQETLPPVTVLIHANSTGAGIFVFWMSKVFSEITKVEVQGSVAAIIGVTAMSVGARFTWNDDFLGVADIDLGIGDAGKDEEIHIFNKNQGIGLPLPVNPTMNNDSRLYPDIRSVRVETASAALTEANHANVRPFVGGAGGGGFILGQYRGASDTINGQVISYANVAGDPNKIRIDRNGTDTVLAVDNSTNLAFYTGGVTIPTTSNIMRYTIDVFSTLGARVGGLGGTNVFPS